MGDRWLKRVGLASAAGLLALPLIPMMVASSSPVSTTINAQADSFASSWAPVSNYGRNQTLRTHGSWPTRYAFLRFNVPSGSISKATLYLYSWTTNSRGVSVHPATSSWSERRVTYLDQLLRTGREANAPSPRDGRAPAIPIDHPDGIPVTGSLDLSVGHPVPVGQPIAVGQSVAIGQPVGLGRHERLVDLQRPFGWEARLPQQLHRPELRYDGDADRR